VDEVCCSIAMRVCAESNVAENNVAESNVAENNVAESNVDDEDVVCLVCFICIQTI
jgi:hypothetical protein